MKTQALIFLVIGLLVGIGGTALVMKNKNTSNSISTNSMSGLSRPGMDMSLPPVSGSSMSMGEMTNELKGLSGDEFDKKFISEMIAHHQGAIDMANMAKNQAKHQEIKDMAEGIISAQTKEIDQMQAWQKQWGY